MKSSIKHSFTRFILMAALCWVALPVVAQNSGENQQSGEVRTYMVKPGDTLFSISQTFGLSVQELSELNGIENGVIRAGMELNVVLAPLEKALGTDTSQATPSLEQAPLDQDRGSALVVQTYGEETLASIAARLEMSEDDLLELNPEIEEVIDRLNQIKPDQERTTKLYVVKAGDTMFSIAKANGLTIDQLSELNALSNTSIRLGQKLKLPGSEPIGSSTWTSLGIVDAVQFPETYLDRLMASQLVYDDHYFVIGHTSLPIGTLIMVGRPNEGPSVLCIVADESLTVATELVDVSAAVAAAVGLAENEHIEIYTLK